MSRFQDAVNEYRNNNFARALDILASCEQAADSYHLSGLCLLGMGDARNALEQLASAVNLDPTNAEAASNLALALQAVGEWQASADLLTQAIDMDPKRPESHNNLGVALRTLGRPQEAVTSFENAISLRPDYATAHASLAISRLDCGDVSSGRHAALTAVALDPSSKDAWNNLAYVHVSAIDIEQAVECFVKAADADPGCRTATSNHLLRSLSLGSSTPETIFKQACAFAAGLAPQKPLCRKDNRPGHKIGYIGSDFRTHPVGLFIEPLIDPRNRCHEAVVFSSTRQPDAQTDRLRGLVEEWIDIASLSDREAAEVIARHHLDVLIELGGHTAHSRLGVLDHRPAPVQLSWLGYSATTGHPNMDGIIVDPNLADRTEQAHYTEKLVTLHAPFLCFRPPTTLPEVRWSPSEPFTFGCYNAPAKFSPEALESWAEILRLAPSSRLVFKYRHLSDPFVSNRLKAIFESYGVDPSRIEILPYLDRQSHFESFDQLDVMLDTFPYTGATTTVDSLLMSVPVVTLRGQSYVGRMSASLLSHSGLGELVATSEDEYVQKAVGLYEERKRVGHYRANVRQMLLEGPVCDEFGFVQAFEQAVHAFSSNAKAA